MLTVLPTVSASMELLFASVVDLLSFVNLLTFDEPNSRLRPIISMTGIPTMVSLPAIVMMLSSISTIFESADSGIIITVEVSGLSTTSARLSVMTGTPILLLVILYLSKTDVNSVVEYDKVSMEEYVADSSMDENSLGLCSAVAVSGRTDAVSSAEVFSWLIDSDGAVAIVFCDESLELVVSEAPVALVVEITSGVSSIALPTSID